MKNSKERLGNEKRIQIEGNSTNIEDDQALRLVSYADAQRRHKQNVKLS